MPFSDLQIFHPLAVAGLAVRTDALPKPLTIPHNLTPADKERLVTLLLSALRAGGFQIGSLIRLDWENRWWLNNAASPSIACRSGDALWLIVKEPVDSAELFGFADTCDCLTLIDFRYSSEDEHVQWMAALKNSLLDAAQTWWHRFAIHDEADEVNFTAVRRWFESPVDALDYCNTIAAGLMDGHSLVYVERQAMAEILAAKAKRLAQESLLALIVFALRERWEHLRFAEPKPLPEFAPHYAEWQTAGLGWLAADEFVPLPALERLAEREVLAPFFDHWNRQDEANARLFDFWDELRMALAPPESAAPQTSAPVLSLRPPESISKTSGTPESIRQHIATMFPDLSPEADDSMLQAALIKESDENRRLLLLAWRVSLWLDNAGNRKITDALRLRAENDVTRTIDEVWGRLNLKAKPPHPAFAVAENWARLRVALADHLTERARMGQTSKLIESAVNHLTQALHVFQSLKIKQQEANVLKAMGDLLMRVDDLAGARASYEKALPLYRQIEDRLGEANVLQAMGDLLMRVADLAGARASYEKALPLYRQIEDRLGEANVLKAMGDLLMRVADLAGARASYEKALPLYRQIEDRLGEANVLKAMGDLLMRVADLAGARASYEKALPLYRQIEDRLGEANVLQAMGDLLMRVADLAGARASYEKALPLYRQIEDRLGEANVLKAMGDLLMRVDDLAGARASYEKALPLYRQIEDRLGEANVLQSLGNLAAAEAMPDEAEKYLGQSLKFHARLSNLMGVGANLVYLARVAMGRGKFGRAVILGEYALAIFRAIDDRFGQALTLNGQAPAMMSLERMDSALAAWWQALTIFKEINDPNAERLEAIFGQVESQAGKEEFGQIMTMLQTQAEEMRLAGVAEAQQIVGEDELIGEITEQLRKLESA